MSRASLSTSPPLLPGHWNPWPYGAGHRCVRERPCLPWNECPKRPRRVKRRGAQVGGGEALFALERGSEKAAKDEAERRLSQALANLEDARKGKRPTEI